MTNKNCLQKTFDLAKNHFYKYGIQSHEDKFFYNRKIKNKSFQCAATPLLTNNIDISNLEGIPIDAMSEKTFRKYFGNHNKNLVADIQALHDGNPILGLDKKLIKYSSIEDGLAKIANKYDLSYKSIVNIFDNDEYNDSDIEWEQF